ncbi:NAD(P)-binding protein [Marivibrio halodurans]|uniref:NAD(P)-binding protein n=1 Tax=Marivibrio halodurans TaxID=2039722 RepID=A0A8J7V2F6_9PROT|nr:NAD(P)-binding protein [Marivibrio halodurans]MBP5855709.1 NAD(P)-binding protein [Marivibrio halodurans]
MARDPRFDILFEPVTIGPKTARNRFYQVPHCTGMGRGWPRTLAAMRGVKAEGGWAVVNTEYCSIDRTSDDTPYPYARLWDEEDLRANALMVEAVREHGSLAGVELWHGGSSIANLASREPPFDLQSLPARGDPIQSRKLDAQDIRDLRRWHRQAAERAYRAGFDVVYVYATHGYLLHNFLLGPMNDRRDEYGGCLENRARIVAELVEETREATKGECAVAVRFTGSHSPGGFGPEPDEIRDMLAHLGPLADLWDLVCDDYGMEMGHSRFVDEGVHADWLAEARGLVGKPVVSVGRYTTPDAMATLIRRGAVDFIGAARPSIADPFLPNKIEAGEPERIRECIGCNICYAFDTRGAPIRCTQNPTMGEEGRRGWHPERVPARGSDRSILIVGGGPAGLEAACTLGRRGYDVVLAEASNTLGGRAGREARLPGLSTWARVRDYRLEQLTRLSNVETYLESPLDAAAIRDLGHPVVALATGARWRRDGMGRWFHAPVPALEGDEGLYTPDDLMGEGGADILSGGPVAIFDDDQHYMASVLAEMIRKTGRAVTLITTAGRACAWGAHTEEDFRTNARLIELGVEIVPNRAVSAFAGGVVETRCIFTDRAASMAAPNLVLVTSRAPEDGLYHELTAAPDALAEAGIGQVARIGDALAPGLIAHAVHGGHRFAREIDDAVVPILMEAPD